MKKLLSYYLVLAVILVSCGSKNSTQEKLPISAFTVSMLDNSSVAFSIGTTHESYITTNHPNATMLNVDGLADVPAIVREGKARFGIYDTPTAMDLMKESNDYVMLNDNLFSLDVAVAFNSNQEAIHKDFNDFLKGYLNSDRYKDAEDRWLNNNAENKIPDIETPTTGKKIKCAITSSSPPYVTMINNELQGFEIEMLKYFALEKGYQIEFVDMNFGAMISYLSAGKAEMMTSGVCVTEERSKKFLFATPHSAVACCVFGKKSDWISETKEYIDFTHPEIKAIGHSGQPTVDDTVKCYVGSGIIAAVEGTIQEQYASSVFPTAQISMVKEYSDALLTLLSGKSDFVLTNYGTSLSFKSKEESLELVLKDIFSFNTCFGINKQNKDLKKEINSFLAKSKEDGTLEKLNDKWFKELSNGKVEDYQLSNNTKVLKVGTTGTAVPFNFVADGVTHGLDIEVISLFCKEYGYKLEVVKMPFGALVSSIVTGKVDVIANTLNATPERLKSIDFTDSYSKNCFTLIYNREEVKSGEEEELGFFAGIVEAFNNNVIKEQRYKLILDGLVVTIIISLLSIIFGTILGAIICFLSTNKSPLYRAIAVTYITIVRGTPVLVLLMINFYVIFAKTPLSPIMVATISFAMNFAAYVSEMFRTSIEGIDKGQREAGLAMGFTKIQTFILIIAPQAIKRVLPIYKGEAISLVKTTSIVGYIAVQDITKVGDIIRSRTFDAFFPLLVSALLYFLIAYLFAKLIDLSTSSITKRK